MAGQVAVGVEVAVEGAVPREQQVALLAGFVVALLGFASLALAGGGVVFNAVVQLNLANGGTVQVAPAVECAVELLEGALKHRFGPS